MYPLLDLRTEPIELERDRGNPFTIIEPYTKLLAVVRTSVLFLVLSIAYLSFRAYRRTGDDYLRNATIGFTVVAFGVFIEEVLFEIIDWDLATVHIIETIIVAHGFAILLYSLLR